MPGTVEMVADAQALVGEGALWDPVEQCLYWVDIRGGRLFRHDPATGENRTTHRGVNVGGLRRNKRGGLVLGTWEGVWLWRSPTNNAWWRRDPEYKFNDVTAGPDGSFYGGAYFDERPGKLY